MPAPTPPQTPSGPWSSLLAAAQSIAQAINSLSQNYLNIQGAQARPNISTTTLLKGAPGRVAVISVVVAGSTTGKVIDSSLASASGPITYVIPTAVGVYVVNLPCAYGILVTPGTSQVLTVSYS